MKVSLPKDMFSCFTRENLRHDLPASVVVFLVALPLCMGVAIASGAPVTAGLVTGIVGGIVVGFLGGSPLQISGPAAGLTVIVYQFLQTQGIERFGIVILVAGLLQILAATLRLGQWFRAVSPAVIHGMLAGIGILIVASQFHVMLDDTPQNTGLRNILTIPQALMKVFPTPPLGSIEHRAALHRELQELETLHLRQSDLRDRIHHLLTDVAPESTTDTHPAPASTDTLEEEASLKQELQSLARDQAAILAELTVHKTASDSHAERAQTTLSTALDDLEAGRVDSARPSQDQAAQALAALLYGRRNHAWAACIGVLTIATMLAWQLVVTRTRLRILPAPLMGVLVATAICAFVTLPILYVEIPDNLLGQIYLPGIAELKSAFDVGVIVAAIEVALIASAETLLSATAVDQMHRGPRTQYDRELAAQGIGNAICGLLSALPLTGVIVRSSANVQAGARSRLSTMLHGLWLLLFVMGFAFLLRRIPTACLAAILVYAGVRLVDVRSIRKLAQSGRGELMIYAVTLLGVVTTDLMKGVLLGVACSIIKLLYVFSRLEISVKDDPRTNQPVILLKGSATFLRLPRIAEVLDEVPAAAEVRIDVEQLDYIDPACLDLLENWQTQRQLRGGRLIIDRESLAARFWRRKHTPAKSNSDQGNGYHRRQVPI